MTKVNVLNLILTFYPDTDTDTDDDDDATRHIYKKINCHFKKIYSVYFTMKCGSLPYLFHTLCLSCFVCVCVCALSFRLFFFDYPVSASLHFHLFVCFLHGIRFSF